MAGSRKSKRDGVWSGVRLGARREGGGVIESGMIIWERRAPVRHRVEGIRVRGRRCASSAGLGPSVPRGAFADFTQLSITHGGGNRSTANLAVSFWSWPFVDQLEILQIHFLTANIRKWMRIKIQTADSLVLFASIRVHSRLVCWIGKRIFRTSSVSFGLAADALACCSFRKIMSNQWTTNEQTSFQVCLR